MKTWNLGFKDVYDFYFTLVRINKLVARYRSRGRKWVNLEENKNSTILGSFERQYRQECQEKSPLRGLLGKNFSRPFSGGHSIRNLPQNVSYIWRRGACFYAQCTELTGWKPFIDIKAWPWFQVSSEADYSIDQKAKNWNSALLMHFVSHCLNAKVSVRNHWFLRENLLFERMLKIKLKPSK